MAKELRWHKKGFFQPYSCETIAGNFKACPAWKRTRHPYQSHQHPPSTHDWPTLMRSYKAKSNSILHEKPKTYVSESKENYQYISVYYLWQNKQGRKIQKHSVYWNQRSWQSGKCHTVIRHESPDKWKFIHINRPTEFSSVWLPLSQAPSHWIHGFKKGLLHAQGHLSTAFGVHGCSCFAGKFGQTVLRQRFSDQTPAGHISHVPGCAHKHRPHTGSWLKSQQSPRSAAVC